jgi:phosphatidylglycerophosphate synthase
LRRLGVRYPWRVSDPRPERPWDLPNLLTLSRIPLAGLVWLVADDPPLLLALLALAALTDVLDGWVARRLRPRRPGERTPEGIGAWLDPLCDKVFVISALAAVWVAHQPHWALLPLVATRELIQAPLVAAYVLEPDWRHHRSFDFRAAALGKANTVLQFATVTAVLFHHPTVWPLAGACSAVGFAAAAQYLLRAWRTLREPPPE